MAAGIRKRTGSVGWVIVACDCKTTTLDMRLHILLVIVWGSTHVLAQYNADGPLPPRPVIPGAIPAPAGRPQFRPRIQGARAQQGAISLPARVRRPGAIARGPRIQDFSTTQNLPDPQQTRSTPSAFTATPSPPAILAQARPIPVEDDLEPRPVEEQPIEDDFDDIETDEPQSFPSSTPIPALPARPQSLQPAVFRPAKPAFRPERPVPASSAPIEDLPVPSRQQIRPQVDFPTPSRQQFRQSSDNVPTPPRQQIRGNTRPAPAAEPQFSRQGVQFNTRQPQPVQQAPRQPQAQYKPQRNKKPVAQVLRKYREDNPDGSITWGYENDDGTFKEETIGVDCIVRGKYGYTDPDGVRREYTYTSGNPCDKEEEERLKEGTNEGFIDYQNNKFVLPNGDAVDLESITRNKGRRPIAVAPKYRN